MRHEDRIRLWDSINEYVKACGGDTSEATISDSRMSAVVKVEKTLNSIVSFLNTNEIIKPDYDVKVQADPADPTKVNVTCQVPASWCERGLIDLPDNPIIQMETEVHEKLRKSLVDATVEEQVEFVKRAVEMGCSKLIIPFTDDPMGYPPGTGGTPEQVEAARKSILEHMDSYILAGMQRITAIQADEDAKVHAALDALAPNERDAAVYHQESLTALIGEAVTGKPGYEGRDPADLVCVHASGSECGCICHADPSKGIIIHDRYCCERCPKCGFRTVLP